jgi:hypothetical protein
MKFGGAVAQIVIVAGDPVPPLVRGEVRRRRIFVVRNTRGVVRVFHKSLSRRHEHVLQFAESPAHRSPAGELIPDGDVLWTLLDVHLVTKKMQPRALRLHAVLVYRIRDEVQTIERYIDARLFWTPMELVVIGPFRPLSFEVDIRGRDLPEFEVIYLIPLVVDWY